METWSQDYWQEPRWFCIRSQLKHEHIAAACLKKFEGVQVFCPRVRFQRATKQGRVWVTESMFPNYLFAQFNPWELLNRVRYGHGVSHLVSFGGRYAIVPDEAIEQLRESLSQGDVRVIAPPIGEGDRVVLARGAFTGLEAVVQQVLPGEERVRLLLEFLGRKTEMLVGTGDLVPELPPEQNLRVV